MRETCIAQTFGLWTGLPVYRLLWGYFDPSNYVHVELYIYEYEVYEIKTLILSHLIKVWLVYKYKLIICTFTCLNLYKITL